MRPSIRPSLRRVSRPLPTISEAPTSPKATPVGGQKNRTSKTSQKHVDLPTAAQDAPLPDDDVQRNLGERLSSEQRDEAGYQRLTAYRVCDEFNTGLLSTFLKREHAVTLRIYDEAIYSFYHLPLRKGYQSGVNVRSCLTDKAAEARMVLSMVTEADERGYEDTYFPATSGTSTPATRGGYIQTSLPLRGNNLRPPQRRLLGVDDHPVAEAIFFKYGVVVFYGFERINEWDIIEDLSKQGIMIKEKSISQYEVESFHFAYDPFAPTPRIYNDFFTFKSPSHLLKLAVAHAIAQSTLLASYEVVADIMLEDPLTVSIPRQLAEKGEIKLKRRVALRLTGQLFKMRQNVNLKSHVLDVPELFWSEASLQGLYDAVREYMEIDPRVKALNLKLDSVADLLDVIHEHLNNYAMKRITIIIIWLIVAACVVELGEVLARWILAAATSSTPVSLRRPVATMMVDTLRFAIGH